ncbi:MAG: hypothetical protein WAR79_11400 [Melioribacteraceae bacterium]
MKKLTFQSQLTILILFSPVLLFSQHRNIDDKTKIRKSPIENEIKENEKEPGRTRNDELKDENFHKKKREYSIVEEPKISKPIKTNHPNIKTKPVYIDEVIEIQVETFIVESHEIKKINIEEVYPNFPLRFLNAEINYIYSKMNEEDENYIDIYEMRFEIKPKTDSYFSQFGIQIFSSNDYDYLQIFNQDEETLFQDSVYNFTSEIELEKDGYVNLRIGFYDKNDELFYPAIEIPHKTDLLIFVKNVNEKLFIDK